MKKQDSLKHLQTLKNVGPKTSEALYSLGIKTPSQLKKANPEKLYEKLKKKRGGKLDRCVLYLFRGAISNRPWPKCMD